eukprot:1343887-Amorphochlora_amoeboformis.AAC.1
MDIVAISGCRVSGRIFVGADTSEKKKSADSNEGREAASVAIASERRFGGVFASGSALCWKADIHKHKPDATVGFHEWCRAPPERYPMLTCVLACV